jgi:DNA-binding MarR family transcriptional regulator
LVLPWQELRLNPLRPPEGVSPRRWAQVFSEIFSHATALLSGSKNYLLKKIVELYKLYGLFDDVSGPYPSLHELQRLIEEDSMNYVRKASDYRETVLNRLEAMNLTSGTVFDCSRGYGAEELLQEDVVFEFDGLSRDVQNFLMEVLFAYVYEHRLAQNRRGQGLNHVFFLDEGKRVFSVYKERQEASGIPEIDELTAKMREFGEGLVVADQEASKLTDSIKANTYTKMLLSTSGRKQFEAMTEAMNLSERQAEFASELDIGEAVVQVGSRSPVPVDLDNFELEKQVSDEQLRKTQLKKWDQLSHEPRSTTQRFRDRIAPGRSEEVDEPEIIEDPQEELDLSHEADRLLEDVVENPFNALTKRYSRFSSSYKGNKAKNELVEHGAVIERQVKAQDGKRKLLQFTEKGRDYIENELDLEVKHEGRGGVIHRYWQHRIKEQLEEQGVEAFLETFDADVYVNLYDRELVVEVAMGDNPREIEHIEKHLDKDFIIYVAARNQEILEGLKQRMQEKGLETDHVDFRTFREFNDLEEVPG